MRGCPLLVMLLAAPPLATTEGPQAPVTAIAFAPDGASVVVGSQAGVEHLSWPGLAPLGRLAVAMPHVHDLAFAPNGALLAVVGGSPARHGALELYHWPSGEPAHRSSPHRDSIHRVAWHPGSSSLVTASMDTTAKHIDPATGEVLLTLQGHSRGVLAACFLPDGRSIVTAGADETVRLWDAQSGRPLRTLTNHTAPVLDLAPRPLTDGPPMLASASDDRTVRLWQPTIGRLVRFARLESPPTAITWTTDGRHLLVACRDGRLRVMRHETAAIVDLSPELGGIAYDLAEAPDGSALLGGQGAWLKRIKLPDPEVNTP